MDGDGSPDFSDTRGNNVLAQEDLDADDTGGFRPSGGAGPELDFDFPFDPALDPGEATNLAAAVVQLFYANNALHDLAFLYGFDEAAGNFQQTNSSGTGAGGDPMVADALDGVGYDNASMQVPPDGSSPRMTVRPFLGPRVLEVTSPATVAGDYAAAPARFGPQIAGAGTSGAVLYVDDGIAGGGTVHDACQSMPPDSLEGVIALVDGGLCTNAEKVFNCDNAGAIGVVVINHENLPNGVVPMNGNIFGDRVTIPSLMIGNADGARLLAELPAQTLQVTLRKDLPDRDGVFDSGLLAHEFAHGISLRLTGGPSTTSCLFGGEQAGEGWSDFWALAVTAQPQDTAEQPRGTFTYLVFQGPGDAGVRRFPYSTDPAVNPLTYGDVADAVFPHDVGEVWASLLWDMYWALVERWGFAADLYGGSGGNTRALQLVLDGLKLQPCGPTFTDARDAILLADQLAHGGEDACLLWRAFARRGLGARAVSGTLDRGDEEEDFSIPDTCLETLFADGFESGDTSRWSATSGGGANSVFWRRP